MFPIYGIRDEEKLLFMALKLNKNSDLWRQDKKKHYLCTVINCLYYDR